MTWSQGINFRATAGYVSGDAADTTYEISTANNYPRTTPQGNSVGWESGTRSGVRDRNATADARLAGVHTCPATGGVGGTYRIDLPAAGDYTVTIAAGDYGFSQTGARLELFDGSTSLGLLASGNTGAQQFYDASGVLRTSTVDWVANNVTVTKTFTTTTLRLKVGGGTAGANAPITHLRVQSASSVAPYFHHGGTLAGSSSGSLHGHAVRHHTGALSGTTSGSFAGHKAFTVTATPSGSTVHLAWAAQSGALGYAIERDGTVIAWNVQGTSYDDTTSVGSHTYRVGVLS